MTRTLHLFAVLAVLFCSCARTSENRIPGTSAGGADGISKASISFRIGVTQWMPEGRYAQLLQIFDRNRGVTDEITFFTQTTHAPLPPDVIGKRMELLKTRMEEARKHGYKTGINILTTIGHHNENLDNSLKGNYTCLTNINGAVCKGSFCPNDDNVREYVRSVYEMAARANPDYIWIDDDVRFGHMPVGYGCFCDNCLEIFGKEYGKKYSREELKIAFDEGSPESKLAEREKWLQHNRNTISGLFSLIERTVHSIGPKIKLGFMTGDRFYEGYDFDHWARILAGPDSVEVMWRPGGGYYSDIHTNELAGKSHDIGRQVSLLPSTLKSIQSEIECFPYQRLKKAESIIILEACSHIAAGCTGAAFNVLSMYDEPLDEFEPLIASLKKERPFFDLLASQFGRSPVSGAAVFWNKESYATGNISGGNWLSSGNPLADYDLFNIGIPVSYSAKSGKVIILGKDNVYAMSESEIRKMLSGGVYMDAEALEQLNRMGFGKLTGFEVTGSADHDRIEKFSSDPLNGDFAARERDNRQSFWPSTACELRKTDPAARVISSLVDYTDGEVASCTSGVFENSAGGRIFIGGYYPWSFMENLSKSSQIKNVFRWLSNDSLPAYVASFHRINLWVREHGGGRIALAMTNSSFDPAEKIVLMLNTTSSNITVYDMQCRSLRISSSGSDGPYRKFVIPEIGPWQMGLVTSE
jgi:hypothetical protein